MFGRLLENYDQLYHAYTIGLIGYALLIFAPRQNYTKFIVPVIALVPALIYAAEFALLIINGNPDKIEVDLGTLDGFVKAHQHKVIALMAWIHFHCTDLLSAYAVVMLNESVFGISAFVMGILVALWWAFAPIAYLILAVIVLFKQVNSHQQSSIKLML
ncbi:hypothetical protein MIR68_010087 [Amoeboaphelidium protococcarum]|nr:hypothetical protein MIR68_010087 [Amoeboaphelidium protococcarum]